MNYERKVCLRYAGCFKFMEYAKLGIYDINLKRLENIQNNHTSGSPFYFSRETSFEIEPAAMMLFRISPARHMQSNGNVAINF